MGIAALGIGIVLEFAWGIDQFGHNALIFVPLHLLIEGFFLLTLLVGISLAACGILALVRWLNWRDNPARVDPAAPNPDATSQSS
jgi:hypothetical protein